MAVYQFPATLVPQVHKFDLMRNGVHVVSPQSRTVQSIVRSGDQWSVELAFPVMSRANSDIFTAFLALIGYGNRFWMQDHSRTTQRGAWSGSPLVNGAHAAGATSIAIDGASNSITDWAMPGDKCQLVNPSDPDDTQLVLVTERADSSGSGAVTLKIQPPMRFALSDNAYVIINATGDTLVDHSANTLVDESGNTLVTGGIALAKFMLADPDFSRASEPSLIASMALAVVEDITT